jgi:hypothetical protein
LVFTIQVVFNPAVGDDYSQLKRITTDGSVLRLENFEDEFGRTIYPHDAEKTEQERQRIHHHHQQVYAILKAKGLAR